MVRAIDQCSATREHAADFWRRGTLHSPQGRSRPTVPSLGPSKQGINAYATGHVAVKTGWQQEPGASQERVRIESLLPAPFVTTPAPLIVSRPKRTQLEPVRWGLFREEGVTFEPLHPRWISPENMRIREPIAPGGMRRVTFR